jgi:hypothetical protein
MLFQVPTCDVVQCTEPATEGTRCEFCALVWQPWEATRERRGANNSGKVPSRKAWSAATKKAPRDEILDGMRAYLNAYDEAGDGWIAGPEYLTTWLRGERWRDKPPTAQRRNGKATTQRGGKARTDGWWEDLEGTP